MATTFGSVGADIAVTLVCVRIAWWIAGRCVGLPIKKFRREHGYNKHPL